jgi:hypothetical protein
MSRPEERGWLEAQRRSWLTIWEITDVDPGRGLCVRDLLTGEDRQVHEVKGSRVLVKRDAVLGRVVDHDGISGRRNSRASPPWCAPSNCAITGAGPTNQFPPSTGRRLARPQKRRRAGPESTCF